MLQMKTDLLKVNRLEKLAGDSWVLESAKTGSWVSLSGSGVIQPAAAGDFAVPIFTESNRDGTAGFTGDTAVTLGVTVLFGKMEAITDQFTGTPAIGDKLYVLTTGKLANLAGASLDLAATPTVAELGALSAANAVAICTKASAEMEWFGNTISVIEYVTV